MRKRMNFYYKFLRRKLGRDRDFINKVYALPISYEKFEDFRQVCKCKKFSKNLENNIKVALKEITLKFLKKDAIKWIKYEVRKKKYQPLYKEILRAYIREFRKGGDFEFKEFGSFKLNK